MSRVHYLVICIVSWFFFFSSRRRHTRCALVTGVQTCALPISPADARQLQQRLDQLLSLLHPLADLADVQARVAVQRFAIALLQKPRETRDVVERCLQIM